MNLLEAEQTQSITQRVLVSGLPGSGKTTLVAGLAEKYKLLWFDLENAADTLIKLPQEWKQNINLIRLPDSATYPIASDTLLSVFKSGVGNICITHGKNECAICKKAGDRFDSFDLNHLESNTIVVLDSITQLSHSILAHIMRNKSVDYKPERDDWGALRKFTEYFASQFQAAKFNLIVTSHVIETILEDGKTKLVPNFGSAAMSAEIAKSFGTVIYCEVMNKKHRAYSSSTHANSILTKSRTDFRIEDLEVPSLIPLFDKSKGKSEAANPGQIAMGNLKSMVGKGDKK